MLMKKLPQGFKSWVQLYDYLKEKNFNNKTLIIQRYNRDVTMTAEVETYKVTMATVERNAWRELQALRLDERQTMIVIHQLQAQPFYNELNEKAADLLFRMILNCKNN